MRDLFKSGSVSQFLIHGNVFDVVPCAAGAAPAAGTPEGAARTAASSAPARALSLKSFLDEVMFENYDVVLQYDRSKGIRPTKGADDWGEWLEQMAGAEARTLALVREPGKALELIDRYLLRTLNLQAISGKEPAGRLKVHGPAGSPGTTSLVQTCRAQFSGIVV